MDDFYRMTPFEVASGWVAGYDDAEDETTGGQSNPRAALETILLPALTDPPCYIEFSGGRDSSAILAVAVEVARRHGLALPVPMTRVFPDVPETREEHWQELVVRHLGITDWLRLEYSDEFDLLGPTAVESLRRHGLLWPPTLHTKTLIWNVAMGGTVVSGEGGDEIFGFRRITPLTALLTGNVHPRKKAVLLTLKAVAPKPIRTQLTARDLRRKGDRPWLRTDAQREFRSKQIEDRLSEPLRWDEATRRHRYRRADRLGLHNLRLSAQSCGVTYLAPFHAKLFLDALANRGGRMGFAGRSAAMRELFGDLLPRELLEREGKAEFSGSFICRYTREFMSAWRGDGVDNNLVDPGALKLEWRDERPHAGTMPLLQATWLRREG